MGIKVKTTGLKNAVAFLSKKNVSLKKEIKIGLGKVGEFVKEEVQSSVEGNRAEHKSVDSGDFLNSIDFSLSNNSVVIFSDVEHAKFLEHGTSRIPARGHFGNSVSRNKEKIKDIINAQVKKL